MQYIRILFVSDEELKTCHCIRSDVNVRAHLLRQNFSSDYRSIRNGPSTFDNILITHAFEHVKLYTLQHVSLRHYQVMF